MTIKKLLVVTLICFLSTSAHSEEKMGIVFLHGKQAEPNQNFYGVLYKKMADAEMTVLKPEMPWSRNRFIDGGWDKAMSEIEINVKSLQDSGVNNIVLVGHSIGSPAALSYASRFPSQIRAVVLLAPGHVPYFFNLCIPYSKIKFCAVKDGVEKAKNEVASGNADKKQPLPDLNQGRTNVVWMTPRDYLSYYDPLSDAEMLTTAVKLAPTIPVLWVIGDGDSLIRTGREYVFEKLPKNTKSTYLEVSANHVTTPEIASNQIIEWLKNLH
jgi:pimeloyl-ACP methyl ester carboxylesterase